MKKCCKESCKAFPFTSEHLWRADLHGMPYGKCKKCGKDYGKYGKMIDKKMRKLLMENRKIVFKEIGHEYSCPSVWLERNGSTTWWRYTKNVTPMGSTTGEFDYKKMIKPIYTAWHCPKCPKWGMIIYMASQKDIDEHLKTHIGEFLYQKTIVLTKKEKLTAVKKWLIVNHRKYKNGQAWKKAFLKMLEGIIE